MNSTSLASTPPVPIFIHAQDTASGANRYFEVFSDGSKLKELLNKDGSHLRFQYFTSSFDLSPSKYGSEIVGLADYTNTCCQIGFYDTNTGIFQAPAITSSGLIISPQISPDGKSITYFFYDPVNKITNIVVSKSDGSQAVTIANTANRSFYRRLQWQPTYAQKLAYTTDNGIYGLHQYIVNIDGSNTVDLGQVYLDAGNWSYDGSKFAYVGIDNKIHLYSVNTGQSKIIATLSGVWDGVSFSPDNTWLTFQTNSVALGKVNSLTGQTVTLLPHTATSCIHAPIWLTNGLIAYEDCANSTNGFPSVIVKTMSNGQTHTIFKPWGTLNDPRIIYSVL